MMQNEKSKTTLGLSERTERVLAYTFFWVSGLALFLLEKKSRHVRWHAAQSMLTFGVLFTLMFAVSLLHSTLGIIPFIGPLFGVGLGLLYHILLWIIVFLWVWLIVMALIRPNYKVPIIGNWVHLIV